MLDQLSKELEEGLKDDLLIFLLHRLLELFCSDLPLSGLIAWYVIEWEGIQNLRRVNHKFHEILPLLSSEVSEYLLQLSFDVNVLNKSYYVFQERIEPVGIQAVYSLMSWL